jgi:DmsE family decaheme c-type cytochrome
VRKHRAALPRTLGVLAAGVFSAAAAALAQTPTPAPPAHPAAAAASGSKCGDCHTDLVKAFAANPHTRAFLGKGTVDANDACSNCHGDGTKHMEAGGDASLIHTLKGLTGSEDCLSCHQNTPGVHDSFQSGPHANSAAVNCLTCHSIHNAAPKSEHLVAKPIVELCGSCHGNQAASFRAKPYVHRLDRGGMSCVDCHAPHARRGEPVKMTFQGELPCLNCHAEKRGPFVFQHVVGSGGTCLSCHESHGSNNPNMLQWAQVAQLCLSCHSQTPPPKTYGSQPPSFHNLRSPRFRNCTTCHVAVHGSNVSPQLLK